MRCSAISFCRGLSVACFMLSVRSLNAATIEGRIVDSLGEPVAGAEVRIWQKLPAPGGRGTIDQPIDFDGGDVLQADAEGRFVSPDALVGEAYARIVAEAEGMFAGRSGWIEIEKDARVKAPDITLKRLRIVTGQVLDRRGEPLDGATVFNSADGHERVETTSKGGGKFRLASVPEGGVFLFAEKDGYRLTGMRLPADQAQAALRLTSIQEPAEPLATLPPLLSGEEERAMAREELDPWLARLDKSGLPRQKTLAFAALLQFDPVEAFERLDWASESDNPDEQIRENLRNSIISVITHRHRLSWDKLRELIDAGVNEHHKARELILATDEMADGERALRLEWLEAALLHARKIDDPTRRVSVLASAADHLFKLSEVERARQILAEAENAAKPLLDDPVLRLASLHLALAAAHDDPGRAIGWLEKSGGFVRLYGGRVAAALLPDYPQQACEVWQRVATANRENPSRTSSGIEYREAADFCYRLALVDRSLAEQIAAEAEEAVVRFREKGTIVWALAETQPAEARRLLEALVREELSRLPVEESRRLPFESAPAIAAWLLPVAEQVAPDLCSELFWRSLALRLPRPRRNDLNDQFELTDIQLAKLLARYDRDISRMLLEPSAARLPVLVALAAKASAPRPVQVQVTAGTARVSTHRLFMAAVHIDPRWAKSLIDTVGDSPSLGEETDRMRFHFVYTLALPLPDRWHIPHEYAAGFWKPSARDQPLPP